MDWIVVTAGGLFTVGFVMAVVYFIGRGRRRIVGGTSDKDHEN
jgi:hypothetical protein